MHVSATGNMRYKPDLRLAESYIPAVILSCKVSFYSLMVPLLLKTPIQFRPVILSFFLGVLYFDHIYLTMPSATFIDTTAICLDVVSTSALGIILIILNPILDDYWGCSALLVAWGICGLIYIFISNTSNTALNKTIQRNMVHALSFLFFISYVALKSSDIPTAPDKVLNQLLLQNNTLDHIQNFNTMQSSQFFFRSILYTLVVLIDAYTFRPLLQQESERLFICKYGAILFSQWQVAFVLFSLFIITHLMKIFNHHLDITSTEHSDSTHKAFEHHHQDTPQVFLNLLVNTKEDCESTVPLSSAPVDSEVIEAFKMAKQQYNLMSQHHGGKTN